MITAVNEDKWIEIAKLSSKIKNIRRAEERLRNNSINLWHEAERHRDRIHELEDQIKELAGVEEIL